MLRWHFNELKPLDKSRDPTQGEFFSTDAIHNLAEALVREAIQNSLDAGPRGTAGQQTDTVKIRLFLATGEHSAKSSDIAEFCEGIWPHLGAPRNGLSSPPCSKEPCPYLVVEDFTTTGLEGDVRQWHDEENCKNSFFYFFRAEGRTGKGEGDRGRWGIGKYVFPRSSRANSFFGVTVRKSDKACLLMGQSILKQHGCEGRQYTPDGNFGILEPDCPVLPTEDESIIQRFSSAFSLSRGNCPGLSIVVPWVDPEITEESLIQAVVRGYFHPILEGKLEVTIATPENASGSAITRDTIEDVVLSLGDEISKELLSIVALAEWATTRKPGDFVVLNIPDKICWSREIIPENFIKTLQEKLDSGDPIALRARVPVRSIHNPERDSHFDIFIKNDLEGADRPVFIREGIIISDVKGQRSRGVLSLVAIEDRPLATLLGDSENPAHTQWQKDSSHFRSKYKKTYGVAVIRFVTNSVAQIINLLSAEQRIEDTVLLKDFFSLPIPPDSDGLKARQKRSKKGAEHLPPNPVIEPRKRRYVLERAKDGFRIRTGDPEAGVPKILEVLTAYDVRRGNALQKYNTADFNFADRTFRFDPPPEGAEIEVREKNRLIVRVLQPHFHVTVTGFDPERDLFVKINVKEVEDAAQV